MKHKKQKKKQINKNGIKLLSFAPNPFVFGTS